MKTLITIAILCLSLSAHAELDYGWGTNGNAGDALQQLGNSWSYTPTPYGQPDPSYGGAEARRRNGVYMPEPYGGTREPVCTIVLMPNTYGELKPRKVCK